jgi:hypothetical protein
MIVNATCAPYVLNNGERINQMIDQLVLPSAEPNFVPYVLIVSMGLAVIAMAIVTIWASQPLS